jgi:uncharacterized protein (TIGR02996 family)
MDQSFLEEIIKDPNNDDPRLIYADYLEENGDPLGELIRLQCDMAKMRGDEPEFPALEKRQFALLKKHKPRWTESVAEMTRTAKVYRGFVRDVVLGAKQFIAHHKTLFERAPIQKATVVKVSSKSYAEFAECESLAKLDSLKLSDLPIEASEFSELMASPYLANLKGFSISVHGTNEGIYRAIGKSRMAQEVRELDFSWNGMESDGLIALLEGGNFHKLKSLSCDMDGISDDGLMAVANSSCLANLQALHLSRNAFGPEGVIAIALSSNLTRLRSLTLNENSVEDDGFTSLVGSTNLSNLVSLGVARCYLSNASFRKLTESEFGHELQSLDASYNGLGYDSLAAIIESPLQKLTRLIWDGNELNSSAPVADLIAALPLTYLSMSECGLRNSDVTAFADAAGASSLRTLILSDNKLNDAAGVSILNSENLKSLACLKLDKNNISRDMQSRLRKKFGAGVCVFSRPTK